MAKTLLVSFTKPFEICNKFILNFKTDYGKLLETSKSFTLNSKFQSTLVKFIFLRCYVMEF